MNENSENVQILPVLPLKNTVLFPFLLMPLSVGRPHSIGAVEAALATEGKEIVVVSQKDPSVDTPGQDELYTIGTRAVVRKMSRPNEESMELLVLGGERVVLIKLEQSEPYITGRVRPYPLPEDGGPEVEALHRSIVELAGKAISLAQPQATPEITRLLAGADDPLRVVYMLASMFSLDLDKEQALLEAQTRLDALRLMHSYLNHEVQVLELRTQIASSARSEMSKEQREYLLRQQMRAIQQELGEKNPEQADIDLLRERFEKTELPEEIRKEVERELSRLERLPGASPEYHVSRTYIDLVLEMPWKTSTEDHLDIARAREVLDEDHFNLKEVKERILEHLGVLKLNPGAKAPILCFVGPPGTGKTSLGQSVARALGRKFERMSLGGMHDESELRGHRRTYIGAMPGRLIQSVRRASSNNPVILLDEVDKLGRDFRGDPAAALLEILDPEQNKNFRDNYLDLPFDLSKVFFITTANTLDTIPRPLLDRMEILRLSGYSEEEKIEIARRYLIPRQLKEAGLTEAQLNFTDEGLRAIISGYTREAGLRRLEQAIGRVARKAALRVAEGNEAPLTVRPEDLYEMLGSQMFTPEQARKELVPGVATGLAWTESGGDVLYLEATLLPDGKGLTLTGQLGEVMQESARAAQSYVWSHAEELGIDHALFKDAGVHLHVPAGAIPKDGPSAGVTAVVALASMYSKCPVRKDTAMTGEITLSGLVLPVGGVKEKALAARRAGIKRVVLPKANEKDLRELPENVRNEIEFIPVEKIEDVLLNTIPALSDRLAFTTQ
ncbi:MAG: endopeptidase La [Bryobacteraceae bacterium]|nr:endopeptidase La [Bryobacterales bacterium]MEB2359820.1 endopeptidase La [Bryobacterales bacterium]NUN02649.1 endopeptidase La [Bryobacteraceae bacterium]